MSIETDIAYLAGVIDSDGCIRVERLKHKNGSVSYGAIVTVQQVESQAVELAWSLFGGARLVILDKRPNSQTMLRWTAKSQKAIKALVAVRPYLRIKTRQADNAIVLSKVIAKSRSDRCKNRAHRAGAAKRSEADTMAMEDCYLLSRSLNKFGLIAKTAYKALQDERTCQPSLLLEAA